MAVAVAVSFKRRTENSTIMHSASFLAMWLFLLSAWLVANAALADKPNAAQQPQVVSSEQSHGVPLRAVGQLSNGCTGFLIGPCHVVTVAHCVYEPWRRIWWHGLEFHPGRNVDASDSAQESWSPLGTAGKHNVRLHPNWTDDASGSKGQPAADAAIIITAKPIGRDVGWFQHTMPTHFQRQQFPANQGPQDASSQQQQQQRWGLSLAGSVKAAGLPLHIAGYPDNRANGSMWQQCCSILDWQLQGNLLWHDCYARGGNSGSPVWVVWPKPQGSDSNSNSSNGSNSIGQLSWDQLQVVGVHSSSLKFPKDSQVGAYAQQVYAEAIAQAAAQQGAASSSSSSNITSGGGMCRGYALAPAPPTPPAATTAANGGPDLNIPSAASLAQPVSSSSSTGSRLTVKEATPGSTRTAQPAARSGLGSNAPSSNSNSTSQQPMPTAAAQDTTPQAAATVGVILASGPLVTAPTAGVTAPAVATPPAAAATAAAAAMPRPVVGRRALLAGAGGREDDGEHVLLPVAVPFTADTLKWVDDVLREFRQCPGE